MKKAHLFVLLLVGACLDPTVPETVTLSVTKSGSGSVVSNPTGISILSAGTSDSGTFDDGTVVTLTAAPDEGWRVESLGGACGGSSPTCEVTMNGDQSASVAFEQITWMLSVTKSGSGAVTSSPAGISISDGETSDGGPFNDGTVVTLTATPDEGWRVESWGEACNGSTTTCEVTMSADQSASVAFEEIPPNSWTLSVTKKRIGFGDVESGWDLDLEWWNVGQRHFR